MLRGNISVLAKVLVHEDDDGREDTEKSAESEDNQVTDTLREGRLPSEEGLLSEVLLVERGDDADTFKSSHVEFFLLKRKRARPKKMSGKGVAER